MVLLNDAVNAVIFLVLRSRYTNRSDSGGSPTLYSGLPPVMNHTATTASCRVLNIHLAKNLFGTPLSSYRLGVLQNLTEISVSGKWLFLVARMSSPVLRSTHN